MVTVLRRNGRFLAMRSALVPISDEAGVLPSIASRWPRLETRQLLHVDDVRRDADDILDAGAAFSSAVAILRWSSRVCSRGSTRWAVPRPLLRTHLPLVRPVAVTPLAVVLVSSTRQRRRPTCCPTGEALADPIPVPWHAEEPWASQADRPATPKWVVHNDSPEPVQVGAHSYWITSSARASTEGGIVRPRALAVLRLITSSNLVGCCTGRSAGGVPRKILSRYVAARR